MRRARSTGRVGIVTKYYEGNQKWRKKLRTSGISTNKKWNLNNKSFAKAKIRGQVEEINFGRIYLIPRRGMEKRMG